MTRKYHHGRGSDKGWAFVALALGDQNLPDVHRWQELRDYLVHSDVEKELLDGAASVWRSYISCLSRERKLTRMGSLSPRRLTTYAGSVR